MIVLFIRTGVRAGGDSGGGTDGSSGVLSVDCAGRSTLVSFKLSGKTALDLRGCGAIPGIPSRGDLSGGGAFGSKSLTRGSFIFNQPVGEHIIGNCPLMIWL